MRYKLVNNGRELTLALLLEFALHLPRGGGSGKLGRSSLASSILLD